MYKTTERRKLNEKLDRRAKRLEKEKR